MYWRNSLLEKRLLNVDGGHLLDVRASERPVAGECVSLDGDQVIAVHPMLADLRVHRVDRFAQLDDLTTCRCEPLQIQNIIIEHIVQPKKCKQTKNVYIATELERCVTHGDALRFGVERSQRRFRNQIEEHLRVQIAQFSKIASHIIITIIQKTENARIF